MKHLKCFEHQFILPLNLLLTLFLTPTHAVDTITQNSHKNTYIVGSELDYPPYALVDEQGQAEGFSVDLIKAVARVMQLPIEFRVGPWNEVKNALEHGEIDILPFVAYSKERDKIFDFTVPHTITYDAYFMRTGKTPLDSEQALRDKTVIVMRADSTYEYLKESAYTKNLILTKTVPESLRLLATGKYDYAFVPRLVGLLTIKKLHLHNLEKTGPIVDTSYGRGYAFAVKEGNDNLLMTLNEGLSVVKATGEYDEIYQKWFATLDDSQIDLKVVYHYLTISGILLLLVAIAILLWLITLKRQVTLRTAALMAEISERKQIENTLQESTAQLQIIFDNTAVGIILADKAGKFLKINTKWAEMTGYSAAELKQLNIQDLTYSEDNQISLAQLKTLTNGKMNSFQMEKRYVKKDQSIFWGSISVSPFYYADGSVQGAIGVVTDITERKETELALQTSEARFRTLVDAIPYGVEEIDTEGHIIFTNIARNRMLGFTEEELAGNKTIWDFMDDASKQEVQTLFTHLLENQPIPTPVFSINYTKTGQAFDVRVDWNYKRDTAGHIVGFVAVLTDVTKQRQAEHALRESEEKYRVLFQLFPVGIAITDPKGQLIEANPFSEKLLDVSVPEHLKHRYDDDSWHFIRPDGTFLPVEEYASVRALKEQKTFTNREMGIVKYNGRITWLSVSATPIPLEQYGVAIAYIDITERKAMEEALQKSEARLTEAQKLAHLGFWEWDLITGEEHCSEELWQILGLSPEKTLFTHELFERAIYPTDSDMVLNAFAHAITEDKHYDLVFRIVRPDNTIRHVHALGQLIRDPKGKIQRFIGTAQDITERRQIEEKVRKSEEKLSAITTNAPAYIYEIDRAGKILFVNRVYEGLTQQDVIGTLLTDWFPVEHQSNIQATINKVFATEQLQSIEYNVKNQQGAIRSYTTQIAPIKIGNEFNSVVLIANDFTERKQMEEALRESQTRLAEAQRIAHVGNWIWDFETNDVIWSDEVYRIFGVEPQKFGTTYQNFLNYIHPNDRNLVQEAVNEARYEKKPYSIDHRIVLPDGNVHFVHEQAEIAVDDHNKPVQMIGIIQDITERKQTEQMLQMVQYTIDNVTDSIFWIDENGHFISCNETACKRLGYTCQELKTLSVSDVDPNLPLEKWRDHWQEVQQTQVMQIESLHRTKTGETFSVEITIHNMQFSDTRYICAWARDITERKHHEQALKESRDFINKINQVTPNVIYVYDLLEQRNFYVNEQIRTFLGYSPQEIRNMCDRLWVKLLHPDDLPIIERNLAQFVQIEDGQVVESEYRVRHAQGEWHWLWSREVIFSRTEQGTPSQILGIVQDITERKLAEEALRINEQHRRTLIEEALIGLILIDKAGTLIEVNSAFAKMIGYTPEEIAGHLNCLDITPPEYFEEDKRQIHLLKERKRFGPYEKEYLHRNGQRVPVRVSGLLIEHKEQQFAWTNVENITTQKHTEDVLRTAKEAAEAANHAKSTFLANMSHELRTPLNGILGYTQLFKLDRNLTPEQQEGIDVIHRSGEHLLSLINDILDLSKVEAGRVELQRTDFNFKSFIDGIIYLFKMRAQQRDIIFNYEQLSHLPHTIHADETRLRQILMNLLGNAVKFTQQKVCLKIGYHLEKIRFQVEDDGIGIADSDVEKIFLPFQQVGDRSYRTQGTGLGLSITKKLIAMMDGTIQVTSILGKGSVFWVELALPEVLNSEKEETEKSIKKPRIVGFEESARKILIVDDIKENRLILLNYLRPLGFEVLEAAEGQEGINMAIEQRPALILMDLIMPEIDGFEAVRQLRKLPTLKNVIIIAISASVFDFYQQKSINVGCNDFIAKPFHYEELLEKIQQHLNLNWVYEIDDDESDMPLKFEGPSPEQANTLLDLAMQGDILGITSYMTELTKQNDRLVLFASEVCHLARNFKTAKICELARRYLINK